MILQCRYQSQGHHTGPILPRLGWVRVRTNATNDTNDMSSSLIHPFLCTVLPGWEVRETALHVYFYDVDIGPVGSPYFRYRYRKRARI